MKSLKIGKINYLNLFPIFKCLEGDNKAPNHTFIEGVPSQLNRLLREGSLDISPSSSIEYLRNMEMYEILEGHSISSFGSIRSIILLSNAPIEKLNGRTILTSSQSETSVALLAVILKRFYGQTASLIPAEIRLPDTLRSHDACLIIGDDALLSGKMLQGYSSIYTYDLGDVWFKNTGLPFVFALWIVRRDSLKNKAEEIEAFKKALDRAKARALNNLKEISSLTPLSGILSQEDIISYWNLISFDLTDQHLKGLELFRLMYESL